MTAYEKEIKLRNRTLVWMAFTVLWLIIWAMAGIRGVTPLIMLGVVGTIVCILRYFAALEPIE